VLALDPALGLEGAQDIGDAGARDPGTIGEFARRERAAGARMTAISPPRAWSAKRETRWCMLPNSVKS